jgi:hypothetical protein
MCLDVGGVDHLQIGGPAVRSQRAEKSFPDSALCPTYETVVDRCGRAILGWAIAPATTALQHVQDATDDAAVVHPLDPPNIRREMRFDLLPLLIVQPKKVPAHDPKSLPKENQNRIVNAEI